MRNYRLKHQVINVCEVDYRICSLLDNQQFDKDDRQALVMGITSSTWSLFGVLWPAAQVLAAEVCVAGLGGKRVLEIGCGIGLASLVLHRMGVDITASDYHPRAREFLDRNVLDNGLAPIKFQSVDFEKENPQLGKFDVIIASDVLYQPHHAKCLSLLIASHSSDEVDVIVVDPGRENRARFTHNMIELGYSHHFDRFDRQLSPELQCKGRILHYQRLGNPVSGDPGGLTANSEYRPE